MSPRLAICEAEGQGEHARFRMYAWAIYHHKIQQAAAGLRVAILDLFANGGREVETFLSDVDAIAARRANDETLQRFVDYDDVWWTDLMRRRLRDGAPPRVEPWLALFTRRRPGPVSLWKRASEFPVADRQAWNARLPGHSDFALRAEWQWLRLKLRGSRLRIRGN